MAFDSDIFWHETAAANKAVRKAGRRLSYHARRGLAGAVHSGALLARVGYNTRQSHGLVTAIRLRTYRYGIIREYGAGRGYPAGNTGPRKPLPWISLAFAAVVPQLADELAAIKGDDFVGEVDRLFGKDLQQQYRI